MSIKAVVFDYGQVITHPQDKKVIDRLAEKAGVAREQFEPLLWSMRDEYDRGNISANEYFSNILSALGIIISEEKAIYEKTIEEMAEMDFDSWKNINAETVALMEDLKKAGYILGILSNMPQEFLDWARINIPVFSLPHVGIFSCELHIIKPEPAIYGKLFDALAIENGEPFSAEELVFFDDNAENIKSAAALGIRAFIWKDPESARRELYSLGVRL